MKGSLKMPLGQFEEFLEPAAVQHNCLEIVLHNVLGLGVCCYLREPATFCPRITAGLVDKQCTSSSRRHGSISCLQIGREECLGSWLYRLLWQINTRKASAWLFSPCLLIQVQVRRDLGEDLTELLIDYFPTIDHGTIQAGKRTPLHFHNEDIKGLNVDNLPGTFICLISMDIQHMYGTKSVIIYLPLS